MGVEITTLLAALLVSVATIRVAIPLAGHIGLVDRPGGHKQHQAHVPLVGGVGIFVALLAVLGLLLVGDTATQSFYGSLLLGAGLLFVVGMIDDIRPLGVRIRFLAQGIAAAITALWGGMLLTDFGMLLGDWPLLLGAMALPVTLFATAGVINALNMADGVDGLSGSLSFVTLGLLAVIAYLAGETGYLVLTLTLLGAVSGFLVFNLRCCSRRRAHVFMGDSGSTMLGFLFACLFIGLSQGEARAMSPVTALWLFALPLFDTTATMVRRMWLRRSPVKPDRSHLHHLLLDAGFTVPQGVALMALLHLLLGTLGLLGWYHQLPEYVLFGGFIGLFAVYLLAVSRPWRFVPRLRRVHRHLELPTSSTHGVFIGGLPEVGAEALLQRLLGDAREHYGYQLYAGRHAGAEDEYRYALVTVGCAYKAPPLVRAIQRRILPRQGLVVRQLLQRQERHDRRKADHSRPQQRRQRDRRGIESRLLAEYPASGAQHAAPQPAGAVATFATPAVQHEANH